MNRINLFVSILFFAFFFNSCSRKQHPSKTIAAAENVSPEKRNDSVTVKKPVIKPKKVAAPKVIVVNDKAAHKSVDGRLYYDLEGHRYWKNSRDGKYYIFNKSMYTNPNFKAPSK